MLNFTIRIPVSVAKYLLYIAIMGISFLVILPFSILTYLNFYQILIPNSSISVPLVYDKTNNLYNVDLASIKRQFDDDLIYNLQLSLSGFCLRGNYDHYIIDYSFEDDRLNSGFFDVSCSPGFIYGKHNWFIPYNLKYWVPPMLVNDNVSINIRESITSLSSKTIKELPNLKITISSWAILFRPKYLYLDLVVEWQGIRYYLFNHYYICFFLGVGLFWLISCSASLLTCFYIWTKLNFPPPKKLRDRGISVKLEKEL